MIYQRAPYGYLYAGHRVQSALLNVAEGRLNQLGNRYLAHGFNATTVTDFVIYRLIEVGAVTLLDPKRKTNMTILWSDRWEMNRDHGSPIWFFDLESPRQLDKLHPITIVDGVLSWQIPDGLFGPNKVELPSRFEGRYAKLLIEQPVLWLRWGRGWFYQ